MATWLDNVGMASVVGPEGAIAAVKDVYSRFADGAIRAGLVVARGTDLRKQAAPLPVLPAADPVGIILTPFASAVAAQLIVDVAGVPAGVLDGTTGPLKVDPPRTMSATFDVHVDWDNGALGGVECAFLGLLNGRLITEDFFLPSGGGATIHSDHAFDTPVGLRIGVCDGVGGTGTMGWSTERIVLTRGEYGIAAYERAKEPSAVAAVTFDDGEPLSVVVDGSVWCVAEATNALPARVGDPVAVRVVAAGADVRGQITRATSPLNGNFALLEGAKFESAAVAGELALVRIGG